MPATLGEGKEVFVLEYDQVLQEIDHDAIHKHLKYLSSFEKLSGSQAADTAAKYIRNSVKAYGIECNIENFDGYLSNPVDSTLEVIGEDINITCRPRSFSRSVPKGLTGELVYDPSNSEKKMSAAAVYDNMKTFRGKIVISYGFDERYEKMLESHGALGLIQVWTSGEDLIHEDTVSGIWGTPTKDSFLLEPTIPVVGVTKKDGEKLIQMLQTKKVSIKIATRLDTGIFPCEIPVASIKGQSDDFILMSCHYDTWYQGAFDNCAANAAAIEIARVLNNHREQLKRSIRIAWWAGHSNGRYAGSTWYNDNHFFELKDHCMAHVTADLLGAQGCNMVGIRTTGVEGSQFLKENAEVVDPGVETKFFPIGRGADQSFWGSDIPIQFYVRYERSKELKNSDSPGPGVYWWHTEDDTYDHIDPKVYKKDANLYFLNIYRLLTEDRLPFCPEEYFDRLLAVLHQYDNKNQGLSCNNIICVIEKLKAQTLKALSGCTEEEYNWVLKTVGGTMNRLCQSSGSQYDQDLAFSGPPVFAKLVTFLKTNKEEESPEEYVFLRTDFIRQENRIIAEVSKLSDLLENRFGIA
jgi:aminopeptidase YwaD